MSKLLVFILIKIFPSNDTRNLCEVKSNPSTWIIRRQDEHSSVLSYREDELNTNNVYQTSLSFRLYNHMKISNKEH